MGVDRGPLQALIRDLGAMPPAVRREFRPIVIKAGQPVFAQMKSNASWSTRIPSAITMRVAGGATAAAEFRVSAARAPHARPLENDGQAGMVRHPVYGNREVWRGQPARPFFYRAVEQHADQVAEDLGDGLMDIAARHGF